MAFALLHPGIAVADTTKSITFADKNLYERVCKALDGKILSKDDEGKQMTLSQSDIDGVTELVIRSANVANVSGLENFANLKKLDFCQNKIPNTSGLATLTKLEELNLYDNVINDIAGIENLTSLKSLNLGYNNEDNKRGGIKNLNEIKSLSELRRLDFSANYTVDIPQYVGNLSNLEYLNIEMNTAGSQDLTPLANHANLKVLNCYWSGVRSIEPLYSCTNLEEVILARNFVADVSGMYSDGECVWPNLKKIDLEDNASSLPTSAANKPVLKTLKERNIAKTLVFNFPDSVDTANLPHTAADGTKYVTYEDFGARGEAPFDDFYPMRLAHRFANSYTQTNGQECQVWGTAGKTYHIYFEYGYEITVKTTTDWKGATFVLHDEKLDELPTRAFDFFKFDDSVDITTVTNPGFTINRSTRSIKGLSEKFDQELEKLNAKGYQGYYCAAFNNTLKQFKRSSGSDQQDWFVIDRNGNLKNEIQWDFSTVTSIRLLPMTGKKFEVKNGSFVTNALDSRRQYTERSGTGKEMYFFRGLRFKNLTNLSVSNVKHTQNIDVMSGSYAGFFYFEKCANVEMRDCGLLYRISETSTYDLQLTDSTNVLIKNVKENASDFHRWGVTASNRSKDVTYENCNISVIDSHEGLYNLTVRNCVLTHDNLCLCGQGLLDVSNTTIKNGTFLNLRSDYGSMWNGDVHITDCRLEYEGTHEAQIVNFAFAYTDSTHQTFKDFGYPTRFPNLYVDNLTVDLKGYTSYSYLYLIGNTRGSRGNPYPGFPEYWARNFYINRLNILNKPGGKFEQKFTANELDTMPGETYNYGVTDLTLTLAGSGVDVTKSCYGNGGYASSASHSFTEAHAGGGCITNQAVKLVAKDNVYTTNTMSIYRNGEAVARDVAIEGEVSRMFTEDGSYRVEVNSVNRSNGGDLCGQAVYAFAIDRNYGKKPEAAPESAPKANAITVAKSKMSKVFKANAKTGRLARAMSYKVGAKAKGSAKLTYKAKLYVKSGNVTKAMAKKFLKISSTGKVTIKKGAPRGIYKAKVEITANASGTYRKTSVLKVVAVRVR